MSDKCKNCHCDSHCNSECKMCHNDVCIKCECEKCQPEEVWPWQDSGVEMGF